MDQLKIEFKYLILKIPNNFILNLVFSLTSWIITNLLPSPTPTGGRGDKIICISEWERVLNSVSGIRE